jgi:hypothetical protein
MKENSYVRTMKRCDRIYRMLKTNSTNNLMTHTEADTRRRPLGLTTSERLVRLLGTQVVNVFCLETEFLSGGRKKLTGISTG